MSSITVHTDGSCFPNPGGPGGWSAIIEDGSHTEKMTGSEGKTTNNRMEILPVLRSLLHITPKSDVVIYSDSQYVVKTIGCWKDGKPLGTPGWIAKWKQRNWHRPNEPLKNIDLWQEVYEAIHRHSSLEMRWIRGHSGHKLNEECDSLANKARQQSKQAAVRRTLRKMNYKKRPN